MTSVGARHDDECPAANRRRWRIGSWVGDAGASTGGYRYRGSGAQVRRIAADQATNEWRWARGRPPTAPTPCCDRNGAGETADSRILSSAPSAASTPEHRHQPGCSTCPGAPKCGRRRPISTVSTRQTPDSGATGIAGIVEDGVAASGKAEDRIPDESGSSVIGEATNVSRLGWSSQVWR